MDLRHLRAFTTVAELRSFSRAAQRLHLSQPPLSRHIRQLEDEVGIKLFERASSGVALTREGSLLLEKARAVLTEATGFVELASRTRTGATAVLRVGMAKGLCEAVNRIRVHLHRRCPAFVLEGTDMTSSRQYEGLRDRTIDIGVLRHVSDDPCVLGHVLFRERFVAVVSKRSPLARRKSVRLKQLADETLLLHEREFAALFHDKILSMYAAAGVTPKVVTLHAEPGEQASMLAVASGKGICLALRSALSMSYVQAMGVTVLALDESDAELQVQVAWRKGETSHTVQEFVKSAREVFLPAHGEAKALPN